MKYKLQKIIILCFLMCLSLFASIACNQQHTHVFDQKRTIHKYIKVETNCINDGTCYYSCSCGEQGTQIYVYSKATGHNFGDYKLYKEGTCDSNAKEIASCINERCAAKDIIEIENSKSHLFSNYVYNNDATCEENGTETSVCSRGGCKEKHTRIKEGTLLNHKFLNYISDRNATYSEDGTKTAKCVNANCDKTDTIIDEGSKLVLYHTVKIVYNNEFFICYSRGIIDNYIFYKNRKPYKY